MQLVEVEGLVETARVMGYYRSPYILAGAGVFLLCFFLIAGIKRTGAVFTMLLNIAVVLLLIQAMKRGYPPLLAAFVLAGTGVAVTMAVILRSGRKLAASLLGAAVGILSAGLLTSVFMKMMHISGMFSMDARMLLTASRHLSGWDLWDLRGLVAAGVIVASMGAVIDISVSVVSALWQVSCSAGMATFSALWKSGMRVGRDIIATMINSLILVFLGVSLPMIAVFEAAGIPFIRAVNYEFFSILILSAIVSTVSLVVTVPATCAVSAAFFRKQ
ncbi:MAG: YibE/F family protein [Elusimicrobiota bacterium]